MIIYHFCIISSSDEYRLLKNYSENVMNFSDHKICFTGGGHVKNLSNKANNHNNKKLIITIK